MMSVVCIVIAALLLSIGTGTVLADDRLIRDFVPGNGQVSVGIVPPGEDTDIEGPQAIYAGDSGEVYLLDQLNGRILQFDPADPMRPPQSLTLPDDVQATDIIVRNHIIYAWDGQVRALEPAGPQDSPSRGLMLTRGVGPPDESVLSAFAQMGSASEPEGAITRSVGREHVSGRRAQTIATRGKGMVTAEFSLAAKDAGVQIEIRSKGAASTLEKLKLQVANRLGAVEVLDIDARGRTFVFAENIPRESSDTAATFVARYSPAGSLEGIYELPLNSASGLARRFVTISPEGDVYYLRNGKDGSNVLGVGFRALRNAGPIDLTSFQPKTTLAYVASRKGANAAVRPLTRAQVLETARAFVEIRWRVNPAAYGSDPDTACSGFNRVRRPGYLRGKVNQEVQGIPYCWGCMGSLPQVAVSIERGVKAGNICTRNDPRPDVTGVDCSAFVSASWGLSSHFTTLAIPSISKPVADPFDMLPGDALNKPGSHVMLFVGFTPDRKVEVMESSTGGCNGKVCRNTYPLGSLLARGYHPVRYRGLVDDTSKPSLGEVALGNAPTTQAASAKHRKH